MEWKFIEFSEFKKSDSDTSNNPKIVVHIVTLVNRF